MSLYTLKDLLARAKNSDYALGHFNFSDSSVLKGIVEKCVELGSPAFLGTSEGEAKFIGHKQAAEMVRVWREELGHPVFLNSDHHKTLKSAKAAVDAGYDAVHIDEMELTYEENIKQTRELVEYAKSKNPEISIEGGIGYLRGSSEIHKERIEIKPEDMTTPEEAREFIEKTGVDRLAVVFGNIHGISLKGNPRLDLGRLKEIHDAIPEVALTLHGGSGITDEDIKGSLSLGMSNVHVNTDLRVAFHDTLLRQLKEDPDQTTPYKFLADPIDAVKKVVEDRLKVFGAVHII